ncbi:hypothetical protein [Dyadobacter fanqingshengii]|uniref:Collagen-like protein n=1 Tax=Dyadobacter fanqingshengii TaxID=2906443 RepID=A0A9X1PCV5_9BACT|nr:hypothetical protein [Dyadobacter fanqingshengii]MCF0042641.1 hypothetical protein [Dyadobacter fanqingshengii]MCF2504585.1 hypothetical protein [Dyadobacter fanqingshengii]USJ36134.1 hypothetical protein NFI81_26065 [Dyadobacter fanqingshengii]
MKKIIMPLLLAVIVAFQGCKGPEGPQGPQGDALVGTTFDLVGVDFLAADDFQYGLTFADAKLGVDVLESDAVLVYINWGTEDVNGTTLKTYRLLPQTAFLDNGILTYNTDRTAQDFSIFLDGTVNLNTVIADYTRDQDFRVVIIPADFAARTAGQVDYSDYNAVVKAYNIDESKIKVVKAN